MSIWVFLLVSYKILYNIHYVLHNIIQFAFTNNIILQIDGFLYNIKFHRPILYRNKTLHCTIAILYDTFYKMKKHAFYYIKCEINLYFMSYRRQKVVFLYHLYSNIFISNFSFLSFHIMFYYYYLLLIVYCRFRVILNYFCDFNNKIIGNMRFMKDSLKINFYLTSSPHFFGVLLFHQRM